MFLNAVSDSEAGLPGTEQGKTKRVPSDFLAFRLGHEEYGVDILRVQEIRSYEVPTRMFNTPDFILGVMNLRGVIVPIADMRIKFRLTDVPYDSFTVVIVLNIGNRVVGMVVDSVTDVVVLTPEQMRPVPQFSGEVDTDSLLGIGAVADRMLILLNIEKVMERAGIDMASWGQQLLQAGQASHESRGDIGTSGLAFGADSRSPESRTPLTDAVTI